MKYTSLAFLQLIHSNSDDATFFLRRADTSLFDRLARARRPVEGHNVSHPRLPLDILGRTYVAPNGTFGWTLAPRSAASFNTI